MTDPDFWNEWDTSSHNISSDVCSETASTAVTDTWGTCTSSSSGDW